MKCYQIFYNSCASTLAGPPTGFGVRTATEGTPQEYISLVLKDVTLRSYNSGKFTYPNPSKVMMETPEKIYEYPKRYFFRHLPVTPEKSVYVLGRAVATVFDHDFYSTGKMTRPGNYVVHLFFFDEFPGKQVFSLFQENNEEGVCSFLPKDWTPVQDNPELRELMLGKPQMLPAKDEVFAQFKPQVRKEAVDLFFSYKEALTKGQALMVAADAADEVSIYSGLIYLLPEQFAKAATAELNHQSPAYSKTAAITFVNQHYPHPIYENTCHYVDFMKGKRTETELEKMWRPFLEDALTSGDMELVAKLAEWIYSPVAVEYVTSPVDLNSALFDYCNRPGAFKVDLLDSVQNVLPVVNKAIAAGKADDSRMLEILSAEFVAAGNLEEYINAIRLTGKAASAGFDTQKVVETARKEFTPYLLSAYENFVKAVDVCEASVLNKYADSAQFPELKVLLPQVLDTMQKEQLIKVAAFLLPQAEDRVDLYVELIKKTPEKVAQYSALLDNDKLIAEKVDYMARMSEFHACADFADFFYGQLTREVRSKEVAESLARFHQMAECNTAFAKKLFSETRTYTEIYNKALLTISADKFEAMRQDIEKYVLDLLPEDMAVRKTWALLRDVLAVETPDNKNVWNYYKLAVKLDHKPAIDCVAPMCVAACPAEEMQSFATLMMEREILSDQQILDQAAALKDVLEKKAWLKLIGTSCSYDYAKLEALAEAFSLGQPEAFELFMKENFEKEYKTHRKEVMKQNVKTFFSKVFSKKDKKQDEPETKED